MSRVSIRSNQVSEARTVADSQFVAIDFETTGLYPSSDRIIELGGVRFTGRELAGQPSAEFQALVNPGIPIGVDAARISGITDSDVADAPAIDEVMSGFLEFIGDAVIVAHNAPFDVGFLRAAVSRLGLPDVTNRIVDTIPLAMKAFPRRRSYGLQNLAVELGLPPNQAHRALDDAVMCMRLFGRCVDELSFMGDLALNDVLTEGA